MQGQPKRPMEEDQTSSKRAALSEDLSDSPHAASSDTPISAAVNMSSATDAFSTTVSVPAPSSTTPSATVQILDGTTPQPNISLRAIIPIKIVGSIIGRSGQTIRNFREESGAKINISDTVPGATERILTITGTVQGVAKAFYLVSVRLEEENASTMAAAAAFASQNGQPPPTQPSASVAAGNMVRLLVPNSQVGSIIGKSGNKIKELQEQSGARITVSEDTLHQSTERAVSIMGAPQAVHKAVYEIACRLVENPEKGQTIPYRPVGRVASPQTSTNMYMSMPSSQPPSFNPYGSAYTGQIPTMNNQGLTQQQLYIPSDLIGAIIGKGGSKITEVRQRSGAQQIKIEDAVPGATERLVTIIGTPEANHAALYMLYHRLQQERPMPQ